MKGQAVMEAVLAAELPSGEGWQYEPKWDGFRCLAKREGDEIELISKNGKPLGRYFPEIVDVLAALTEPNFLLDGELIIPLGDSLSFEALQLRLHPAKSRMAKFAGESPSQLVLFDLLSLGGDDCSRLPLSDRRSALEAFFQKPVPDQLRLSPATTDRKAALGWLERSGGALDGVIGKRLDQPYKWGERAMVKVKPERTADCVIGGFRYAAKGRVGSLLLGLYDDEGLLHHVGFTSAISAKEREQHTRTLEELIQPPGFTGSAPGGPSRWRTARSAQWEPLKPVLVAEVKYDQVTSHRFRHGTGLLRFRPDKDPKECTFDQLKPELRPSQFAEIFDE
jgi:ATP-dependent DNA ligase